MTQTKTKAPAKTATKATAPADESPAALIDARIAELGDWRGETLARLRDLAYDAVLQAIARHGGNKKQAALELGISRSHLYKMLERGGEA